MRWMDDDVSQELVLAQVDALNDVAAVEEHAPNVLRVDGAREVRVAEVSTVRHRYFLHTTATRTLPLHHPCTLCMGVRAGICVPPTVTYLPYRVSGSTLTAVGRSQLLARWSGTHSRILPGIQRAAQTVLGVYLKRTCSRVISASSALGVLTIMRCINPRTHSLT